MIRQYPGFTLVEIAIVLVIISLLLGGVLKGQELIGGAKIRNMINDFSSVSSAIYAYQDRYKALPGDDRNANGRWGTALANGNGDGLVNLVTDGAVCNFYAAYANTNECALLWDHLRQAGFITGAVGSNAPTNAFGGVLGVQDGGDALRTAAAGSGLKGPIICQSNVPDKAAIGIDNQLDDGNPTTGAIRALLQTTNNTPNAVNATAASGPNYVENGSNYYTLCKSL